MTDSPALTTALAYYRSWSTHDFEAAMPYLAEDIVVNAPAGRLEGATAFRAFMEPFSQMVTRTELLAAFGDDRTALLMYDTATGPVPEAPGAELLTVADGLIIGIRMIFDREPFAAARAAGSG